jgi:hypothetical protein
MRLPMALEGRGIMPFGTRHRGQKMIWNPGSRLRSIALLCCALAASAGVRAEAPVQGYDAVLRAHVKDGQVDYPAIAADKSFAAYVAQLAEPFTAGGKAETLAHYMNAYNALAIQGIIEGYSPSGFIGRQRYFKSKTHKLNGRETTLYDLEHKLILPLGEPRIHFSIVCASKSCPKLRSEAYTAARLERQLEDNTKGFVNDSYRNNFDKAKKIAYVSEIFKWFESDFIAASGSVPKFLARYVNDAEVAKDLEADSYAIKYIDYNWGLNGIPPGKS